MREIASEIEINAPALRVWEILADFPSYPEWNRFLPKVKGQPVAGTWIRFVFELPRGVRVPAVAAVLKAEPGKELRWAGGVRGLFRAEHYFLLEPIDDSRLRFRHGEIFTGVMASTAWRLVLERGGPPVYEEMNLALKQRAENAS